MKGYTCTPHSIWENDLTMEERYMYLYLLDCENKFNKMGEAFNITNEDLKAIGFGKDEVVLKGARTGLIDKGYIEYTQGNRGRKSNYLIKK